MRSRLCATLVLALSLVGCGGESNDGSNPPPPPAPPSVRVGAPATVSVPAGEQVGVNITFNVAAPGNYQCDAHAGPPGDGTDAQMALLQGATQLAENSDDGDGTDARITQMLQPGAYTIRVWEWMHRQANITVTCIPAPAAPASVALMIGAPATVAVPAVDGEAGKGTFTLTIASPGTYQCDAHAGPPGDGTDAQMALLQGATQLAENSDDGEGTDARITQMLQPGTYTVKVWEWLHRAANITVTCIPAPTTAAVAVAGPLTVGTPATVMVPTVAAEGPAGQRDFMLAVMAPSRLQCTAHGDFNGETRDAQMAIVQNGVQLHQDSDSGGNFDARITFDAQPGTYQVRVWEWMRRDANVTVTCIPAP